MRVQKHVLATVPQLDLASGLKLGSLSSPHGSSSPFSAPWHVGASLTGPDRCSELRTCADGPLTRPRPFHRYYST